MKTDSQLVETPKHHLTTRLALVFTVVVVILAASSVSHASELLHSFSAFNGGGYSPCLIVGPAEFFLGIEDPNEPWAHIPVGRGLATWNDGDSGFFDITPRNEALFTNLSTILTNGSDDFIYFLSVMPSCNSGSGGFGGPEPLFFPRPGDLIGNQIDFVRLYVSNVHIETLDPKIHWQAWTADVTYEYWGTTIPEPAIANFILLTLSIDRRRRLRRST